MEEVEDKRVRVFKFDEETEIKNFVFLEKKKIGCEKLLVILGDYSDASPYYFADGISKDPTPRISPPDDFDGTIARYTYNSKSAVVKDQLHIFGGDYGRRMVRRLSDS